MVGFNPRRHTTAPVQTEGVIRFAGSPDAVFARIANHPPMTRRRPKHGAFLTAAPLPELMLGMAMLAITKYSQCIDHPRCICPIGRHPRTISSLIPSDREKFRQITTVSAT